MDNQEYPIYNIGDWLKPDEIQEMKSLKLVCASITFGFSQWITPVTRSLKLTINPANPKYPTENPAKHWANLK